jgi:hypothetical protein
MIGVLGLVHLDHGILALKLTFACRRPGEENPALE